MIEIMDSDRAELRRRVDGVTDQRRITAICNQWVAEITARELLCNLFDMIDDIADAPSPISDEVLRRRIAGLSSNAITTTPGGHHERDRSTK